MEQKAYSPKIKPEHLTRKAIVYLRQSSERQVRQNIESQRLQYEMAERIRGLGWQEIEIINSDLGCSAAMMESITRFLTRKLKLKVNEAKSAVTRPHERKFLGFSFTDGPEVKRAIAPKALERFKKRIREITRRAKGVSTEATMVELVPYLRGWRGYLDFHRSSRNEGLTSRTAVYGHVRTVVWQGSVGDCRPYADVTAYWLSGAICPCGLLGTSRPRWIYFVRSRPCQFD
jgi:Group II intron, maturase-specific domain